MDIPSPAIDVENVSFRFANGLTALSRVNVRVAKGEIVALIGPSGCGKSTLLNVIAGLLPPSGGLVRVDGQQKSNCLGSFSYLPQKDGLLPWRTTVDNAALLLEVRGVKRAEARERAHAMLDEFGLSKFASSLPQSLSGGMRQRVALIRTVLPGHDVLMDEPFASLDAITRMDVHEWMLKVHEKAKPAILLVTHDVDEALLLADRLYVMSSIPGRILQEVAVPWARPRGVAVTATPEFTTVKAQVIETLRQGIDRSESGWAA